MSGLWLLSLGFAMSIDHSLQWLAMKRHQSEIVHCYEMRLPHHPGMEGSLVVQVRLESDGRIMSAEIKKDTLEDPAVGECIRNAFLHWNWPPSRFPTTYLINYPFHFHQKPPRTPTTLIHLDPESPDEAPASEPSPDD